MNSPHWLNAPLWLPLVHALLHTLWQGALAAGGLWLILRWVPARRVGLRYGLCLGALSVVLLLGVATWATLDSAVKAAPAPSGDATLEQVSPGVALQVEPSLLPAASTVPAPAAIPEGNARSSWPKWAAAFWLAGVLVCLIRTTRCVLGAGRLRRRCQPLTDPRLLALVEELRTRLRLSRPVRLLVSSEVHVPAVLGVVWPAILLPAAMLSGLPVEQFRAILAHELAHLRRWDYLVNLGQMLIEALLFFNPFVWWISRQVRLEREACCDQVAAAECASPVLYVEALVAVIERHRSVHAGSVPQPMLAASGLDKGSGKSHTLDRARRLLVPEYLPQLRLHWFSLGLVLVLSGLALGGLWTSARAMAQTIQPPPGALAKELDAKSPPAPADDILCNLHISTPDGKPVAFDSAEVRFHLETSHGSWVSSCPVATAPDGSAPVWIKASASSVTLVVIKEGFAPMYCGPFLPPLKEKLEGLHIRLGEGSVASIQTVDEGGQPIAGAQIMGYYFGPPEVELSGVKTDATGTATIEHLGEGSLNVRVRAEGFEDDELVNVRLDPAKPYRWTLKKGSPLSGTVVALGGQSLTGATIKLAGAVGPFTETHFDPRQAPLLTTADSQGRFTLTTLRPDSRYYFFVEAPGYGGVFLRNIKRGQGTLEVTLGSELSVRGRIINVPPAMTYQGKFTLSYGQTFRIDNTYSIISQQLEGLEPREGGVEFRVGGFFTEQGAAEKGAKEDLDAEPAHLSVRNKRVNFSIAELPKADLIFDLGGETAATDKPANFQVVKESPPPTQPSIEIESKFIEIPDAIAKGLTFPRADSFMDKFPGTTLTADAAGNLTLRQVLNKKDAEELLRQLNSQKGVDIVSVPRVTTRSQQRGVVEIIREFRYPTEYERDKTKEGKPVVPTVFETRNVGITLEVEPTIGAGDTIDLKLKPQVVEFLGFVSYPSGEIMRAIREPGEKFGDRLMKSTMPDKPYAPDEIRQPVFFTRQTTSDLAISSGQTVVFLGSRGTEIKGFEQPSSDKQLLVLVRASLVKGGEPSNAPKLEATPTPSSDLKPASDLPAGTAVEGKPGFVISPHSPNAGYIDVRGFPSGAEVKDPYSKKMFRVP